MQGIFYGSWNPYVAYNLSNRRNKMQLMYRRAGGTLTVFLSGELDQHSAAAVRTELEKILDDESLRRIVFDMGGVTFMDSSGIGVILGRYRRIAPRGGSMNILNAKKNIERVLRMSGVYKLCTEGEDE